VLVILCALLGCHLSLQASAYPLRSLQDSAAESSDGKNCVQINVQGDVKCDDDVEPEKTAEEVEEEDATDTQIIAIVVGSIIAVVVLLSAGMIIYTLARHKTNVDRKKHLGIQL